MFYRNKGLRHYVIVIPQKQIVIVRDETGRRILDGKHPKVRLILLKLYHQIFKSADMMDVRVFSEILNGGCMPISSGKSLKCNTSACRIQLRNLLESQLRKANPPCHSLVLIAPAQGHHLKEQLADCLFIKVPLRHTGEGFYLFLFPLCVIDRLPCPDFKLRHLTAEPHSLFKQIFDLLIYFIQFNSDFR